MSPRGCRRTRGHKCPPYQIAAIFNVKPTVQDDTQTDNGFKYESVQFGLNGAAYFARLWHKF